MGRRRTMTQPFRLLSAVAAALAALILLAPPLSAGDSRVPMPELVRGKGENCLEPNAEMRRYHMVWLKHQREETMHEGIRGNKYSLKACVECHSVPDPKNPDAGPSLKPFCKQCHEYAAVSVDCFTCHTTKPQGSKSR